MLYKHKKVRIRTWVVFSGLHTITKKESEIVMKEKKTRLSVMGVVLIPPALLILLLADLLHPLPVIIFDLFLVLLFLLYGLCADLYLKFRTGIRHRASMQSLNAGFYFLWMVVLAYRALTHPALRHLPLILLLFALALTLFVLSLRKYLLIRAE
jgi:hypothetical protein